MKILKKTRSLCPKCFKEIGAKIFEENNRVYMQKKCSSHGNFKVLLEKDISIYSKLMNQFPRKTEIKSDCLMIPFTHKCNLNCKICYFPYSKPKDIPLKVVKNIIKKSESQTIRISGGEPTLREDLPKLISYINQLGKSHSLITNGINLEDGIYVKKLSAYGLNNVHLSFNSFDDNKFLNLDGKVLLQKKLKSFENLRKNNIKIVLSTLLARGMNENEIKKLFNFYLKNNKHIIQWRIRSGVQIGKYANMQPYTISELLDIICGIIGLKKEILLKAYSKRKNNLSIPCTFDIGLFYNKFKDRYEFVLAEVNSQDLLKLSSSKYRKFYFGYKILKQRGITKFLRYLWARIQNKSRIIFCDIKLRSWPTKHTIDLNEISYCPSRNLAENGKIYPFCYSLILNEKIMAKK